MNPSRLRPLLAPRSIAIVGASESPDSWAPEIYRSLRHVGYPGAIYPINPKYDEVWGRPCLSSPLELPRGVDLVVGKAALQWLEVFAPSSLHVDQLASFHQLLAALEQLPFAQRPERPDQNAGGLHRSPAPSSDR